MSESAAATNTSTPTCTSGLDAPVVDLAPGATAGVLFDGMTADGSTVFFTARQTLDGADTDASADLYAAPVDAGGSVSTEPGLGPGAPRACNPVANAAGPTGTRPARAPTATRSRSAAAAVSPPATDRSTSSAREQLDGAAGRRTSPTSTSPGRAAPAVRRHARARTTRWSSTRSTTPRRARDRRLPGHPRRPFRDLPQRRPLTGVDNFGFRSVFLYDADAERRSSCASCNPSGTEDPSSRPMRPSPPTGLSLTDDGRVFFTHRGPARRSTTPTASSDVYEWADGRTAADLLGRSARSTPAC